MRTTPDALAAGLARGLRGTYLVTGAEPMLIAEAAAAVRAAARDAGYTDREVHFLERGFDWNALLAASANLSLFADRRLIELKLGSGLDAEGQRSLAGLAEHPPADGHGRLEMGSREGIIWPSHPVSFFWLQGRR